MSTLTGKDATSNNILKEMSKLFYVDKGPYELIVFYFSGHGIAVANRTHYIAPVDMQRHEPLIHGIKMKDIDSEISDYFYDVDSNTSVILILDCCQSITVTRADKAVSSNVRMDFAGEVSKIQQQEFPGKSKVVMASGDINQRAREIDDQECSFRRNSEKHYHGIFTSFIIKGLQGGAATSSNYVTCNDLMNYLGNALSQSTQHPQFKLEGDKPGDIRITTASPQDREIVQTSINKFGKYIKDGLKTDMYSLNRAAVIVREFKPSMPQDYTFLKEAKEELKTLLKEVENLVTTWCVNNLSFVVPLMRDKYENPSFMIQQISPIVTFLRFEQFKKLDKDCIRLNILYYILDYAQNKVNFSDPKSFRQGYSLDDFVHIFESYGKDQGFLIDAGISETLIIKED